MLSTYMNLNALDVGTEMDNDRNVYCDRCGKRQRTRVDINRMRPVGDQRWCSKCWQRKTIQPSSTKPTHPQSSTEQKPSLVDLLHSCPTNDNGIISVPTGGRPMSLLPLPAVDVRASQASQRTMERRTSLVEKVIETMSHGGSTKRHLTEEEKEEDVIALLAHLIKKPKMER